jgi:hypothetical protein
MCPCASVRFWNSKSWLAKVCANKGIDHLKAAYKRRKRIRGPGYPMSFRTAFRYDQPQEGESPKRVSSVPRRSPPRFSCSSNA